MAMNYTPIPNDFLEEMADLSDAEYGRIIRWCQTYITTGDQAELRGNERLFLRRCKMQMDRYIEHYGEISEKRAAAGRAGGVAKASNCQQTLANASKSGYTKTNTKTKTNITPPKGGDMARAKRFAPPTPDEVAAYCAERENSVDAQRFVDFYAAKDWMIGKNRMKDWKAAVRTWERKEGAKRDAGAGTGIDRALQDLLAL